MSPDELQVLLDGARNHCADAEEALVAHHAALLRHLVVVCLHHQLQSRLDPEDIAQEVWADFFSKTLHGTSCPSAASFLSYLRVTVPHKVADALRKHLVSKKRAQGEECSLPAELPSKAPSAVWEVDRLDELEHVLQLLPARERLTVSLRLEGYTNAEIAAVLGVTEQTVRNYLHRFEGQDALAAQQ